MKTGVSYGKPKEVQVHVVRQESGAYELAGQDLEALDALLISQEKLTKKEMDQTDPAASKEEPTDSKAEAVDSTASLDKTERQ